MTLQQVLAELEELGTPQNRKVYARHGVGEPVYGVSYANLDKLRKRVGRDGPLAEQLWETGNHDARVLATMIADPAGVEPGTLDAWVEDLDSYVLTDAFARFAAATPHARRKMVEWTRSREEWPGRAGWLVLAQLVTAGEAFEDSQLARYLMDLEGRIGRAPNRVRDAMNSALIAIGAYRDELEEPALAAARRIGTIEVDHGEVGRTTPDAAEYIRKTRARSGRGAAR